jgi:predicted lipoprotein with Yx(FWY)xxD motif
MAADAAGGTKLEIQRTSLRKILATGRGLTVYMFTRDSINHDSCVAISGCTGIWPLVTSSGRPSLGPGVKRSLVGAITLSGGVRQVTYAGHPLYTYLGDSGPGDTSYVGQSQFGGKWYALSPAGRAVR